MAVIIAGVERIISGRKQQERSAKEIRNVLPDLRTNRKIWPNIRSGSMIGTFIGAIPGTGGDIAIFVSYGFSKSAVKRPSSTTRTSRRASPPPYWVLSS